MPSAKPRAQAASTLPPTYSICVRWSPCNCNLSSNSEKNFLAKISKDVTTRLPARSSIVLIDDRSGTWTLRKISTHWGQIEIKITCNEHFPKPSRSISVTWSDISDSKITSWPVMPRSTFPFPTKDGISAAGRKTLYASSYYPGGELGNQWHTMQYYGSKRDKHPADGISWTEYRHLRVSSER